MSCLCLWSQPDNVSMRDFQTPTVNILYIHIYTQVLFNHVFCSIRSVMTSIVLFVFHHFMFLYIASLLYFVNVFYCLYSVMTGRERSPWCEWNSGFPGMPWTERCQGKDLLILTLTFNLNLFVFENCEYYYYSFIYVI